MRTLRSLLPALRRFRQQRRYAASRHFVLSRFPQCSIGAEIGVWKGEFSSEILHAVNPRKLHLIDPWKYQAAAEFSQAFYGGATGASQENMDALYRSVVKKFRELAPGTVEVNRGSSESVASQFPDNYIDWLYVDGDHRYEGVLKDLLLYHPKLKPGGVVAGDDYVAGGDQWWGDGVVRAVGDAVRRGLYRELVVKHTQFVMVKAS
jgi:Methyltransferase domain